MVFNSLHYTGRLLKMPNKERYIMDGINIAIALKDMRNVEVEANLKTQMKLLKMLLSFLSLCIGRSENYNVAQITAYVDYFGQCTSEQFPDDIAEVYFLSETVFLVHMLIRNRYPSKDKRLFDDVLATFVLHHPEHGHAVVLPIISCIIDGALVYDRSSPPFASFISLVCPGSENEYSEQWALACGEILRILTHYNRPIYKMEQQDSETDRSSSDSRSTSSESAEGKSSNIPLKLDIDYLELHSDLKLKISKLANLHRCGTITWGDYTWKCGSNDDDIRNRRCSGVMGKYAAGELKPPTTTYSRGSGKHPQLMPSTPRWAVANGAGVILSVCDEEVAPLDEHLVAGLPALEPYARLFHRYYAIATPSATQRLLLGLLEAPPSWAPDALDAAVQLVELLRAAEDYASGIRLPRNWMHLHFLRAIGTAMSMRAGIAADAAAALLFRILSQPALLFPPLRQVEGVEVQHEPLGGYIACYRKQIEVPAAEATIEATAQGIASMLCAHGPEVEWRICTIWEAAYGLIPLSSSAVDLPDIIVATPLQPPMLSWNLYIPLLKVLEYLPRGSPSEACLMKIFVATVEAILKRTFPPESSREQTRKTRYLSSLGPASKNLAVAELRTMVHSLFLESCASVELASRLLFVVLTVCVSHEAHSNGSKRPRGEENNPPEDGKEDSQSTSEMPRNMKSRRMKKQGPVAAFDSYVLAAVCALACELQIFPFVSRGSNHSTSKHTETLAKPVKLNGSVSEFQTSLESAIQHTRRILAILEALFSLKPSSIGTSWSYSSNEIVAAAMVAAHVSELFRRSKACMHALSVLMRCKWDNEIYTRASSLYNLIDIHRKVVASIVNKAEPLGAHLHAPFRKASVTCFDSNKRNRSASNAFFNSGQSSALQPEELVHSETKIKCERVLQSEEGSGSTSGRRIAGFPLDASDLANFLTKDRHIGFNCSAQVLLRSVLPEKQELCFSVVSLLWHKLIASPETQPSAESTSAQQGWRQVVDALCNVVSASPTKAATAVVLQAERELQPWIAKDDDLGQKMWRINQRIIKLIAELMRNHDTPESLVILSSASDLLLRATDGMLVDGEACTLPQLELLEATARAVQPVLQWGESGFAVADGLSNLLKCRLPATIRCLSHPSAHVRALSTSVLRDIQHTGSIKPTSNHTDTNGIHGPPYQYFSPDIIDWQADIEKCLTWEAHSRLATGLPIHYLNTVAKDFSCPAPEPILSRKHKMSLVANEDFQHILRVLNTNVDGKQKIMFALTSIKGIGRRFANIVCKKADVDMNKRAGELSAAELDNLMTIVANPRQFKIPDWFLNRQKDYKDGKYSQVVSNALDMKLRDDLERLKKIRNHRGLRHYWGLRVRGQHTKTTGRRGKTVGVSKKRRDSPPAAETPTPFDGVTRRAQKGRRMVEIYYLCLKMLDQGAADAAAWMFNVVTSVGIIIVNKALMATYGFTYATTLTGMHFVTTTLMTGVLRWLGYIQASHLPFSELLKFVFFANFSIVGMNVSLMWNSVGFYQIAKLSMIPVSCLLEVLFDKIRYSRDTKLSIGVVLLGVGVCTVTDVSVNAKGFVAALIAVWSTSLQQYYVHYLQRKYSLSSFNLLGHTAPAQAATLLLLGPFLDYWLTNQRIDTYDYNAASLMFIALSCTIAVGTNLSQFICIGRFTAVSFQVLGHMKTILVLVMGFFFFGKDGLNLHVVLGMIIAVVGMIWYGNASSKPGGKERRSLSLPISRQQRQSNLSEPNEHDENV
ncbi:unnamed protein product [Dovyalis caffra]|uniref:Sugar phosphate transporter domain-containing protein n=3 Tax=rosids TaxID=71275 RepID=A0AAV1S8J2_9ROSI|nr:unnamed protein product [Dovyalis caffra]